MNSICVFLGSNRGVSPDYEEAARNLGRALARRHLGLVYGGSDVGLMGILANEVLEHGGQATGVIPRALAEKEIAHSGLTRLHVVESMHARKAAMAELSDGFIAIPGGLGTLEELFEILTWAQLGFHAKPCGLLNVAGYFDGLLTFLDNTVAQGFVQEAHRAMLLTADAPDGLLDAFASYTPPSVTKWIRKPEKL